MLAAAAGRWYQWARRIDAWGRRRFTAMGACLLIGLVISLGTADRDQTMGLGVFFVLAAAMATALAAAWAPRPRLAVTRDLPAIATAGQPFTVRLRVRNTGRRAVDGIAYTEDLAEERLPGSLAYVLLRAGRRGGPGRSIRAARAALVPLPELAPGAEAEAGIELTAWRRGALRLVGGVFLRADPLGLLRGIHRIPTPGEVLILPPRHSLPELAVPGRNAAERPGEAPSGGGAGAEEFSALRDYRRGDPLKRVHWRSAARTGRLVVKEYEDERRPRHGLFLDTAHDRDDAGFAEAVAVAASFACTVADGSCLLDLLVVGDVAIAGAAGRDPGLALPLLRVLATVRPEPRGSLLAAEVTLRRHAPALGSLLLIFTAWDDERQGLVRRLATIGVPLTLLLVRQEGDPVPAIAGADRVAILNVGRVAADLQALGTA